MSYDLFLFPCKPGTEWKDVDDYMKQGAGADEEGEVPRPPFIPEDFDPETFIQHIALPIYNIMLLDEEVEKFSEPTRELIRRGEPAEAPEELQEAEWVLDEIGYLEFGLQIMRRFDEEWHARVRTLATRLRAHDIAIYDPQEGCLLG